MKIEREEIIGLSASAILLLLLAFLLTHLYLRAETHPVENEVLLMAGGTVLNQGEVDWEGGTFTPHETVPIPVESNAPAGERVPDVPSVITDDMEQSAAIEAERQRKEREERELREREERARQEAERRRQEQLNDQAANLFGAGSSGAGHGAGQGASTGGNQGASSSGGGGFGEFDLGGRGLYPGSALPRPSYTVQEEGTIVITVIVDPQGNVITADVRARGTNITNESMRRSAIEAARKARFAVINQADNQTGTITYRYKLN